MKWAILGREFLILSSLPLIKVSVFPSLCQVFFLGTGHLAVDKICQVLLWWEFICKGGKNKVRELLGKCYKVRAAVMGEMGELFLKR